MISVPTVPPLGVTVMAAESIAVATYFVTLLGRLDEKKNHFYANLEQSVVADARTAEQCLETQKVRRAGSQIVDKVRVGSERAVEDRVDDHTTRANRGRTGGRRERQRTASEHADADDARHVHRHWCERCRQLDSVSQ